MVLADVVVGIVVDYIVDLCCRADGVFVVVVKRRRRGEMETEMMKGMRQRSSSNHSAHEVKFLLWMNSTLR